MSESRARHTDMPIAMPIDAKPPEAAIAAPSCNKLWASPPIVASCRPFMRIDFLDLDTFLAIGERGSFNKAFHLGITQTALSRRIKKFENYLGIALLHRTTRRVSLTPAGLELLPRAKSLLDTAHRTFEDHGVEAAARQERVGIGCLPTLAIHFLPRDLADFASAHPSTLVRIFDNSAREIAERPEARCRVRNHDAFHKPLGHRVQASREVAYMLVCRSDHAFLGAIEHALVRARGRGSDMHLDPDRQQCAD